MLRATVCAQAVVLLVSNAQRARPQGRKRSVDLCFDPMPAPCAGAGAADERRGDRACGVRELLACTHPNPWLHRAQVLVLLTSDAARARAEADKRAADATAQRCALPTYTVRAPPMRGAQCCIIVPER